MDKFPRLRLEPDNEPHVGSDISKFVDDRISSLQCPTEAREYIKKRLCDRSEGTYLWVSFAINALKKVRVIDMERTVESFPRGLDAMYRRMLLAISEHEREKVMEILRWITTTVWPLSLVQLATAVSTVPARGQTLEEAITDEIAYAGDLLTIATRVNHEVVSTSVTLVHLSLLDFLQSIPKFDPDLGFFCLQAAVTHDRLTRRLFDYKYQILQSFDSLQNDDVVSKHLGDYEITKVQYPLLHYAIKNSLEHMCHGGNIRRLNSYHPILDPTDRCHTPWLQLQCRTMCEHLPEEGVKLAHIAALYGLLAFLKYAHHQCHLELDTRDGNNRTLLFYATAQCHMHVIEWLLVQGADPNLRDLTGQTALHIAAYQSRADIIKMLIRHGSRTRVQSSTRITKSMLDGLDRDFGDFNQDEEDNDQALAKWSGTPVHIAATIEQPEVMHILLSTFLREGGSINETDENGRTFLHLLATSHGSDPRRCWDVFSKFPESSEIVNHMLDRNGESALHIATRKSCLAIDSSFQDDFYEDSDSDSEETVWNPVIALVETFGTAVNIQTSTGVTPLHIACKKGASSLVAYLLDKGANARLYDESGQNAMHWLCSQMQRGRQNRPAILVTLTQIMTVEDIEAKRTDGQTARDLAVKHDADYLEIARRHANGLVPNLDMPAEPLLSIVREFCVNFWQLERCNVFLELHGLIDGLLNMVKCEPSSEAIAGLQRLVSEQPRLQHVLEKNRLYWESKAKE